MTEEERETAAESETFEAYKAVARSIAATITSTDPMVVRTSTDVVLRLLSHHASAFGDTSTCPHESFVWTACRTLTDLLNTAEMGFDDGEEQDAISGPPCARLI